MKKQLILILALSTFSPTGCEDCCNPTYVSVKDSEKQVATISSFYPESGACGTVLVIFGENFGVSISDNDVALNGKDCEVLQVQPGKIMVRLPLNLAQGDYEIDLSTRGQTVTSTKAFKVKGN